MLKIGKLDSDVLKSIVIDKIKFKRPEVKVRAGIGEDCGVVDFGQYECVISTDPITAAAEEIGRLCIHISCNDIASNGIEPVAIVLAVMLPVGTTEAEVEHIMGQAAQAAEEIGVEIIGGHTEVTNAVTQPVIVSTAIGRGFSGSSQSAKDMCAGDYILMTKKAGLEGTAILTTDKEAVLADVLSAEEIRRGKAMAGEVSVVKEGIAAGAAGTSGMHDVTEGGILGAIWEMCSISDLGAQVDTDNIHVDPVTVKIADHFGIDYLRLISSGAMIIVASPEKKDRVIEMVRASGVEINVIGRVLPKDAGLYAVSGSEKYEITPPEADELYKAL